MRILVDKKERRLLLLAIVLFVLLCLIETRLNLPYFLSGTVLENFLVDRGVINISSNMIVGILAAYMFYILNDFLPRIRKEKAAKNVLNALIASILDSYKRAKVFGHEATISHANTQVLDKVWLNTHKNILETRKASYYQLLSAEETAHSRLEDFRNALPLAVTLSPESVLRWLIITDKVRLLAENYEHRPSVPMEKTYLVDRDVEDNPVKPHRDTLFVRALALIEQALIWQEQTVE
jgi:hypothetical protein